jgi:hypothetical protein
MTNMFPCFCLVTVKVKGNQMLKGWIPNQNNLNPITPKDDLTPELPMLPPSKVQKQAAEKLIQAAPPTPIHLEDVTLAKPPHMRHVHKNLGKLQKTTYILGEFSYTDIPTYKYFYLC